MTLTAPPLRDVRPAGPPLAPPTGHPLDVEHLTPRERSWLRGDAADGRWVRPAAVLVLIATAVLYLWGLGASGWANSFYSAAAQAGSQSWKALFFGSSDASNFITVDKPPAALWVMGLSVRLFGLNAWSILVPEALMGVASVGVLYLTVKRWFGAGAGLLAGAVLALTPAAALMFRFNNPDALLVLVLTIGAYCMTRALEAACGRWLYAAFALVGLGFLTKMLQAVLVLPAFGLVYLLAAPTPLRRRIWQLVVATVAFVASFGWWVAIVELLPASARPYVGGSQDNSVLSLIFGYNGFGRLTGNETGSVGGMGGGGSRWGTTGWLRLFNAEFGGQASWLLPAALVLLVAGLAVTWRAARTDRTRAALVLWGGWLLVTGATFSLGQGIIHPYYAIALGPALGAVVGIGGAALWRRRDLLAARIGLAAAIAVTAWWTLQLLQRSPGWNPWLQPLVVATGVVGSVGMLAAPYVGRRLRTAVLAAAIVGALAAPAAASIATAATAHSGAIPTTSPAVAGGFGGGGAPGGGARPTGAPGAGALGGGRFPGGGRAPAAPGGGAAAGGGGVQGGAAGGLLQSSVAGSELTAALQADADQYTWAAATIGANQAAGYQLASGEPVMAIGGFNGSDPWPTLEVFQQYVADGRIHYFIPGGMGGAGNPTGGEIANWVAANFTATTIGGTTVYDLTA
jgi:4-amino-4-deoxy-L-arabinose transferase-like glycosyltransferase